MLDIHSMKKTQNREPLGEGVTKVKFEFAIKVTFYQERGVGQNQCHFFKMFFIASFANFSAHPVTFWVHLLNIIACFFSIFEMNSKFIIDCWSYRCVNGEGWIEEICIKCLWCEKCLKDLGFIFIWSSNQNFHLSLLR